MHLARGLIFLSLSIIATLSSSAQIFDLGGSNKNEIDAPTTGMSSGWYSPYNAFYSSVSGDNFARKIIFLYPDSTVKMIYKDKAEKKEQFNGMHTIGDVIDFSDEIFAYNNPPLGQYWGMHENQIDSFYFNYIYGRGQDSMVVNGKIVEIIDTLYVQLFNQKHLRYDTIIYSSGPNAGERELFAKPKSLNKVNLLADGATETFTILLGSKDTSLKHDSGWHVSRWEKRITMRLNEWKESTVGFMISYKPMLKMKEGDTLLDLYSNKAPHILNGITNMQNYFGYVVHENSGDDILQTNNYNNSFYTTKELLYNDSANGFVDFEPSTIRKHKIYGNFGFYFTFYVGLDDLQNDGIKMQLSPNPISQGSSLNYSISNKAILNGNLSIMDISGRTISVAEISSTNLQGILKTQNLKPGYYYLRLESPKGNSVKRFVVF